MKTQRMKAGNMKAGIQQGSVRSRISGQPWGWGKTLSSAGVSWSGLAAMSLVEKVRGAVQAPQTIATQKLPEPVAGKKREGAKAQIGSERKREGLKNLLELPGERRLSAPLETAAAAPQRSFQAVLRGCAQAASRGLRLGWVRTLARLWSRLCAKYSISTARRLRVAETISLGEKRFVAIVAVEGKEFLIGGGAAGMSLLAELESAPKRKRSKARPDERLAPSPGRADARAGAGKRSALGKVEVGSTGVCAGTAGLDVVGGAG